MDLKWCKIQFKNYHCCNWNIWWPRLGKKSMQPRKESEQAYMDLWTLVELYDNYGLFNVIMFIMKRQNCIKYQFTAIPFYSYNRAFKNIVQDTAESSTAKAKPQRGTRKLERASKSAPNPADEQIAALTAALQEWQEKSKSTSALLRYSIWCFLHLLICDSRGLHVQHHPLACYGPWCINKSRFFLVLSFWSLQSHTTPLHMRRSLK